jgi:hypothetical protein
VLSDHRCRRVRKAVAFLADALDVVPGDVVWGEHAGGPGVAALVV